MDKLEALPLHEVLGIPVADLVKAEVHGAQATLEFIEKVGFIPPSKDDHFGDLRLVTFNYYKEGQAGKPIKHEVQVPILSLIPIPLLEIENAELEFTVAIEGMSKIFADSKLVAGSKIADEWLMNDRHEFYGRIDTLDSNINEKRRVIPKIRVKINIKQSDLPTGIAYLYRKMDENSKDISK
jgi:hypothetical protein